MKTKTLLFFAISGLVIIAACKKNNSSSQSKSIVGNWHFISEHVKTQTNTSYTSSGTNYLNVSVSDYTTTYDSGTVSITPTTMTLAGVTYYISSTVFATDYENGVEVDTSSAPFTYYVAPMTSSSSYTSVGADSVYFPNGGFGTPAGSSTTAYGAKIAFLGDTAMTLSSAFNKDSTGFLYGMQTTIQYQATMVTTLHK